MKVMQRRLVHRMIRGTNSGRAGDIGKLSHLSIGDVARPVTIRIVAKVAIGHTAACTDFNIGTKTAVTNLALRMKKWAVG